MSHCMDAWSDHMNLQDQANIWAKALFLSNMLKIRCDEDSKAKRVLVMFVSDLWLHQQLAFGTHPIRA